MGKQRRATVDRHQRAAMQQSGLQCRRSDRQSIDPHLEAHRRVSRHACKGEGPIHLLRSVMLPSTARLLGLRCGSEEHRQS